MIDKKNVATFQIDYLQFLDENSKLVQPLPDFADQETLIYFYRQMATARAFDIKAINLQRTGKIGGYASCRGQEAVSAACGHALRKEDVLAPHYRDQPAQLMRGNTINEILAIWGGNEKDNDFQAENTRQDLPMLIPISTQCLHAVGIAKAFQYRQENRVVLTVCGDGGTSKSDFYTAMNVAGDWKLPVVFVINNNQWAISVPRKIQSGAQTLAQKAIAAGFDGIQVDGNDIVACRYAIGEAVKKARAGEGPTLIEAITYRLCDHTTADDAKRYQPADEVKAAWKKEPIARLGFYLESQGLWSREKEAELQAELNTKIDADIKDYLARAEPNKTDMFDSLYAELPESLIEQREELVEGDA